MPKNKEYTANGVREFYSVKGCNSCQDCANLVCAQDTYLTTYSCRVKLGRSNIIDRRFPYDNTKCKEFKNSNE